MSFGFYKDAGLTQLFNPATDKIGPVKNPPEYFALWLGSPTSGETLQAASNPGTDQLTATIVDASPGIGLEASDVSLAAAIDQTSLDAATPGTPLSVGTTVSGGVANAQPIGIKVDFAAGGAAYDVAVSIQLNTAVES